MYCWRNGERVWVMWFGIRIYCAADCKRGIDYRCVGECWIPLVSQ